jgi:hypothetical protein
MRPLPFGECPGSIVKRSHDLPQLSAPHPPIKQSELHVSAGIAFEGDRIDMGGMKGRRCPETRFNCTAKADPARYLSDRKTFDTTRPINRCRLSNLVVHSERAELVVPILVGMPGRSP